MRRVEVEAAEYALRVYDDRIAAYGHQEVPSTPAELHLADLQRRTEESIVHHTLISSFIGALPKAEVVDPFSDARGVFTAATTDQLRSLRGGVLWGPSLVQGHGASKEERGGWPYYIIGQYSPDPTEEPTATELLLASAAPHPHEPETRFARLQTWEAEAAALELAMEAQLAAEVTVKAVDALYDPDANALRVYPETGFRTANRYESYSKKAAQGAVRTVREDRTIEVRRHGFVIAKDLNSRVPQETMGRYSIARRLVRLAQIFGQTAMLRSALAETIFEEPSALEEYVRRP